MKNTAILDRQTLIDITAQELGDLERVYEIAELNGLSLTDDLITGNAIMVPDADKSKINITRLFADKANAPASVDDNFISENENNEGIGYWIIENDFIIQ